MRRKLVILGLGAMLSLGMWSFYLEPSSLEVHHFDLELSSWPKEQSGLRIALLSDLHVGSPFYGIEKLEVVVERVNAEKPDVVLLAGDYVIGGVFGGDFVPPETTASVLKKLEAPLGIYAVLGNHDWYVDGARVRDALTAQGIRVLEDESVRIEGETFDFWLVGLGDFWEARPNVTFALESVPEKAPVIAFTHNPDAFPEIPERVALTLAGHTHGGQVRVPLVGAPIVPSSYGERYAHGHVIEDRRHLFVTSGLGTSIFPVRFRVPPEIALLRILGSGRD